MEVESIVVDEVSKDRTTTEQSSCSPSQQSTVDRSMAATASQGPLRFFQDASCAIASAQLYGSAELAFTNKPPSKTERVKKPRYSPPSSPPSQSPVQEERKAFTPSAQVAPFSRGFGDSSSFPRLSGMVICPHLHPLAQEPETKSSDRTSKYYSAATFITAATTINEEKKNVAVHQLDTRSDAKEEECWSPLTQEHTDEDDNGDRNAAGNRYSTSPSPLPAPYLDSLTSTEHGSWNTSTSGEDPPRASCSDTSGLIVTRATEQAVVAADSMQEASGDGTNKSSTPGKRRRLLHRPLARQKATARNIKKEHLTPSHIPTNYSNDESSATPSNDSHPGKLLLISPEHDTPVVLGKTKPVPPPKTPPSEINRQRKTPSPVNHQSRSPPQDRKQQSSSPNHHPTKILHPTVSSPAIFSETTGSSPFQRSRVVSFHHCNAGETLGQFKADYLGSKEVDGYVCMVNSVAKQLVDQRPAEVIAFVSSQKIRLAPSKNESVLFKSFAIKDILMVEKCTINKRIIGIVIWKSKTRPPTCHILRCPDEITSKSFYEAVWEQSQIYDDVTLNKISCSASPSPSHSPSHQLTLSDAINDSPHSGTESSTSFSNNSTPSYREVSGFSATQVLHKFPATYIGSAVSGKLHSIDDVIQNVLADKRPTLSKELYVCLSLAEVKLIEVKGDQEEVICMSHETSRIRAIGVYSQDKRFMGYIIKEEGKPLMTYVLRCNSAALMVSLMSFLRQSCQLTSYQRGGSFYDELAADDTDDCDYIIDGSAGLCDSLSIVRRLRSLTNSFSQRTHPSTATVTRPSFQSHTQLHKKISPANDIPQRRRDSITQSPTIFSPFDFTDEDYAKFSVTYVGSAALDPPLSQQSVLDALRVFSEQGTAAGQAAIVKNSIDMQVSALGINLSDRRHKLFINRNYPRKQLEGYCTHPCDDNYFAFASRRPGYSSSLKVHVFKRGSESVPQILDAIQFWLEIDPTPS